ncbi:MAG: hypothetical protein AABX71_02285 [Nanoarchaeota archaeon]
MDEGFHYRIIGYSPTYHLDMSAYNFTIRLNMVFARKCLEIELPQAGFENLTRRGKEVIERVMRMKCYEPYRFLRKDDGKNSALLQHCEVPGQACAIEIDGMDLPGLTRENPYENYIDYNPHNIDSHSQAFCLLSLWLEWANSIDVLFKT